jgi:hypothetical protein
MISGGVPGCKRTGPRDLHRRSRPLPEPDAGPAIPGDEPDACERMKAQARPTEREAADQAKVTGWTLERG